MHLKFDIPEITLVVKIDSHKSIHPIQIWMDWDKNLHWFSKVLVLAMTFQLVKAVILYKKAWEQMLFYGRHCLSWESYFRKTRRFSEAQCRFMVTFVLYRKLIYHPMEWCSAMEMWLQLFPQDVSMSLSWMISKKLFP